MIPTGFVGMLVLSLGMTACGQKGPLYLPDPNTPPKAAKARPPVPMASSPDTDPRP
jgi:predicted small lipoprotein YifL